MRSLRYQYRFKPSEDVCIRLVSGPVTRRCAQQSKCMCQLQRLAPKCSNLP